MWLSGVNYKLDRILEGVNKLMKLVLADADKIAAIQADDQLILADLSGIKTDVDATEAALASALAKIAGSNVADPATAALLDSINSDLINAHVGASATKSVLDAGLATAGGSPPAAG